MFFFQMSHFCFQRTFERKESRPLTNLFFFSRGSPDAPWVTSAEYRRVLRDSKRPVLNEWSVFLCFFCFLVPVLMWRWFSKDVRFFSDQATSTYDMTGFENSYFQGFLVDEIHLVPVLTASTRHLWFFLFYFTSHPAVWKMLEFKKTKPINHVYFFFRENMDIQLPHPFFAGLTCFQLVSWQFQLSWDVGWKTPSSFNTTGSTVSVHLRHEGSPTFPSRHRFPTVSNKKKSLSATVDCGWWDGTCCGKWKGKGVRNWDMGVSKNMGTPKKWMVWKQWKTL